MPLNAGTSYKKPEDEEGTPPQTPGPTPVRLGGTAGSSGSPILPPGVAPGSAASNFVTDFETSKNLADNLLKGNESARISNPYQKQHDEYLELLKKRLSGLDSDEMRAAKEEGLSQLDQQQAQSLERYASIAGSRGVSGGAAAGLMGKALHENNLGRASLERQLILDNIAAKDRAMQAYGGGLMDVTGVGMDVTKYNAGAQDRDTGLKLSLPFDIMSGIGGYKAADEAKAAGTRAEDLARLAISGGGSASATPATSSAVTVDANGKPVVKAPDAAIDPKNQGRVDELGNTLNATGAEIARALSGGRDQEVIGKLSEVADVLREQVDLTFPTATEEQKKKAFSDAWRSWGSNAGIWNWGQNTYYAKAGAEVGNAFMRIGYTKKE